MSTLVAPFLKFAAPKVFKPDAAIAVAEIENRTGKRLRSGSRRPRREMSALRSRKLVRFASFHRFTSRTT
jgi:hypothetical protein